MKCEVERIGSERWRGAILIPRSMNLRREKLSEDSRRIQINDTKCIATLRPRNENDFPNSK
jgi:hypothetical protein